MTRIRSVLNLLAMFVLCLLFNSMAHAQAPRTWVSGTGNDGNPCSRALPCATFAAAISKTLAGGEVSVLDPGGFGAVTITKAITINGDGTLAGTLASGISGIIVSAGTNDVVKLRNLSINGLGSGLNGIKYLGGKHLHVENCTIYGFPNNFGIASSPAVGEMTIVNTTITNCRIGIQVGGTVGGGGVGGGPSNITAAISDVKIDSGAIGVDVLSGLATISNSVISHQSQQGFFVEPGTLLNIEGCAIAYNSKGVLAGANATVRLANCDIVNNAVGVDVSAGIGQTFSPDGITGTNSITGNGTDVSGLLTVVADK